MAGDKPIEKDFTLKEGRKRLRVVQLGDGLEQIKLSSPSSRMIGMAVTPYLLDDILIDCGFAHTRKLFVRYMRDKRIGVICLTHHHEDHSANAGVVAREHGCPVYLHNAQNLWTEGVDKLLPYRSFYWGAPVAYEPQEMPETIVTGKRKLKMIPAPGHSTTMVALFEEATGRVFTGDLYVTGGVTGVMAHENPFQSIESLRRVATLSPTQMFTGHGLVIDEPQQALLAKATRIEEAAATVLELHRRGLGKRRIVRRIFTYGNFKDRYMEIFTQREFSRYNFVRAVIRYAPGRESV